MVPPVPIFVQILSHYESTHQGHKRAKLKKNRINRGSNDVDSMNSNSGVQL